MKKVKIVKISRLEGAIWEYMKNGDSREGEEVKPPTVGEPYFIVKSSTKMFHTSNVAKVEANEDGSIDIQTLNSIYKITYI